MRAENETVARIVELARAQVQTKGYAELHYGSISEALGITRAAVHYHFPSKVDLAKRVIADYREQLRQQLRVIDETATTPAEKLQGYRGLYRAVIEEDDDRICPGGMLAAEMMTLPEELRVEVQAFFDVNVRWVAKVLTESDAGQFVSNDTPTQAALRLVSALQGALLLARLYGDVGHFDAATSHLLT